MKNEEITTIVKPEFIGEIKAEIKGLAEIEDNITEVRKFAIQLKEYYSKIVWSNETLAEAKEEKANVNKFKDKVATFRKNIVSEYNKPIALFETTAKETEKLLQETYNSINEQVQSFEEIKKEEIKNQCVYYFNECAKSYNIDFINFDNMNLNITLSMATPKGDLTKKVIDTINEYVDKINKDIELINTQEHSTEIMVEYKKTLNVSQSIINVNQRIEQIKLEEQKQEEIKQMKQEEQQRVEKIEVEVLTAPKEQEKEYSLSFKVIGTMDQLRQLKQFLEAGGYNYEQQ